MPSELTGGWSAVLLLKWTFGLYGAGIAGSLLAGKKDHAANLVGFGCATLAAACGVLAALKSLLAGVPSGSPPTFQLWTSQVPHVALNVRLDSLGAFFVLVVSSLGFALSLYSLGYVRSFYGRKSVAALAAFYNALLLATTLVFLADNAFFFLMAWEVMALTAFCLVSFEHEKPATRYAGILYFIMSHVGTGCLILGFLLLFQNSGDYSFNSFHAIGGTMSEPARNAAFILFLIGFGVKAGIVPLHIWLPAAHPVAPSNVSALMSAILIKTGIYGLTRVLFDFLDSSPLWWGVTILLIGTISAVIGVLYALMEHDLKRLLAYHSIENIGIILMGLGAALMLFHTGHPLLASMALMAGLYHTINHAVFKGLLFLGAGAVLHATHTRNMEEMGGLIKRMRWTALFFLIGAIAISALPPLNGFVSEWFTYQSLLAGYENTSRMVRLIFPFSAALLALTGALAAACFVKAFGITFLAQPRSDHARHAHEASPTMLTAMALLTGYCVFLGLFPNIFLRWMDPVTTELTSEAVSTRLVAASGWSLTAPTPASGAVSTPGIAMAAICLLPVPFALWWLFGRGAIRRIGPTWDCGLKGLTPQMEYTATAFSKPLRMIFKALFRPQRAVQAEYEFSRYFARTVHFESHIEETFEERFYRPLQRRIVRASRRMRALQAGSLQAYLIYILAVLLLVLLHSL